jgi:glycerol uptake facilitator-like aquaporin
MFCGNGEPASSTVKSLSNEIDQLGVFFYTYIGEPQVVYVWRKLKTRRHWFDRCLEPRKHAQARRTFKLVICDNLLEHRKTWPFRIIGVLQIGLAYGAGIIFAITVCAPTSGGHFSPSITIALTLFRGFPKLKALR